MSWAVMPAAVVASPEDRFDECPLLEDGPVQWSMEAERRGSTLRWWSRRNHHLCSAARRRWVWGVFMVAIRLERMEELPVVPPEMWEVIVGQLLLWELGRVA